MNPATIFPSLTSIDHRPVCRFCLDSDESVCRLIKPCKCRGTVALVHPSCLDKWVQTSQNYACQICQFVYEQESVGLKSIGEWTWPRALDGLSGAGFQMMFIWIAYVVVLGFSLIVFGFSGMLKLIDVLFLPIYWGYFHIFSEATWRAVIREAKQFYTRNTVYKFKDLSTDEERRHLDEVQLQPWKCDYCRDGTEDVSPLIWPCRCRGNVIHSQCLERVKGTQKIDGLSCSTCNAVIEQELVGFRKISEWTWPGPKSDALKDKMVFRLTVTCVLYFLRLVYVLIRIGSYEMMFWMVSHAYWMYWGLFVFTSLYFGLMTILVAEQWHRDNVKYRFKDRSSVTERKEVTSKKSQTTVVSEAETNDQRTEMKTAKSN